MTYNIYRKYIVAKGQKIQSKDYSLKAICVPVWEDEIDKGFAFRRELTVGSSTIYPKDFGLKSFRINIHNFEKERLLEK